MFVAVISRGMRVERVFSSINQKICENWATEEAQKIFGKTNIDRILVGTILRGTFPNHDVHITVLESERFS